MPFRRPAFRRIAGLGQEKMEKRLHGLRRWIPLIVENPSDSGLQIRFLFP